MKNRQDISSINLKQAFEKHNKANNSLVDVFFTQVEPDFLLVLRELAKKERLTDSDLYKITKTIIASQAVSLSFYTHSEIKNYEKYYGSCRSYYNENLAYQEFIRELINQIGQDTLDFFKVLNQEHLFEETDFKEVISNPDFNRIKDIVLDQKTTRIDYHARKKYIAIILEIAKQGIFSNALFEEKVVSSLIDEVFRTTFNLVYPKSSFYNDSKTIDAPLDAPHLNEAFISQKLIELYLKTVGNFRLNLTLNNVNYTIKKAVFCIKIIDLIRDKEGFPMQEVITSLNERNSNQYCSIKLLYIIFNYLNENNLLNYSNYNFFISSDTCSITSLKLIAMLIESKCLDGDQFSPFAMIEMIKSLGHLNNINQQIFNWFFTNNPELLTQKNLAKILSHENMHSLSVAIPQSCFLNYLHEKNSLKSQLVRLKNDQFGNQFFEKIKNNFNASPVYLLLGDDIYYLRNNLCTKINRYNLTDISQIFPKNIGEFCLATIQDLKDISDDSLDQHIQLNQEDFDEILSCSFPAEAFHVIEILQNTNLLTPETKHQVLTNPHQSSLAVVIYYMRRRQIQLNQDQLSRIFECASILSTHVQLFNTIPDFLFNDNTVNNLLNLCLRANPHVDIQVYVAQLINGNTNTSVEIILNTTQSTHTASVHKSVSESAIRLKERYKLKLKEIGFANTLKEIKFYLTNLLDNEKILVNKNSAAKRAIKNVDNEYSLWTFIDPASQICNKEFLALAWIAIHDKTLCLTSLENALESFVKSLYEIQRGYNLNEKGTNDNGHNDRTICFAGAFNKIAEGLNTIHPDIEIIYITKPGAALKINESSLVFDLSLVYFKKKNLSTIQIEELRLGGFESQLFKECWLDLRQDIAKEMFEYREAYKNDKEFDDFIGEAYWALDVEKLCNTIGNIIQPLLKEDFLLGNIPNEIVKNQIFTLFDKRAMASMVQVCKSWYQLGTKFQFEIEIEKQEFAKQQEETSILNGKIKFIFETIKIKITFERECVKNPQKILTHNGYTISEPMEYDFQIICKISTPTNPQGNYVFINKQDSKIRLIGSSELLTHKDIQGVEEVCLHGKNPNVDFFEENENEDRLVFNS